MTNNIRTVRHNPKIAQEIATSVSDLYFLLKPTYTEDLTHQSVRALQFIQKSAHNPRVDDLRQHLGIAPTTASELIKRLATKGMLQRTRSPIDERVVEVALTEKGHETLKQQTQMDISKLSDCLMAMPESDVLTLLTTLERLRQQAEQMNTNKQS